MNRARSPRAAWALAYLLTALCFFLISLAAANPEAQAPEPPAGERETREVQLSGGAYALVHLGEFDDYFTARPGAARHMNRGAAGYLCARDGRVYAVGNAYTSAVQAEEAAARIRKEGIDAGVLRVSGAGLTLRVTATTQQLDALQAAYQALSQAEDALGRISDQLDAGEITAASARAFAAICAYELSERVSAFSRALEGGADDLCASLGELCQTALARASSLTGGDDAIMYYSARVKHARVSMIMDRLAFLEEYD